jgi:hypothetical protein
VSRARKVLFAALTLLLATGASLVAAELFLGWQRDRILASDVMDPGLLVYDRVLGWRLQPGWSGRHRHHDFDVGYEIGEHGFRGPPPAGDGRPRVALVGDSFTFGIGVGEDDTFSARLAGDDREVLGFGVPGYSTDQELLLIEREVLPLEPEVVVLVVCLINDVFDNPRAFPLQALQAKPRYVLRGGALDLERVPVPRETKGPGEGRADLDRLVYGLDLPRPGGVRAFLGRREVFRRLGLFQPRTDVPPGYFDGRYDELLALFDALVAAARSASTEAGADFLLALLPGRSYVERPGSYAHAYQEHLRETIARTWRARGVTVVDLATGLREARAAGGGPWYHPHEGHLNAEGHAEVARRLGAVLDGEE